MASYRDPAFQDRVAAAAAAKQRALEQLKAKPPVDPAILAERLAAREAREAIEAEKRAEKLALKKAEAEAKAARAAEAAAAAFVPEPTEAERKAARDLRYAARKKRK